MKKELDDTEIFAANINLLENLQTAFPKNLRRIRTERNMTIKKLSDMSNISSNSISSYERKKKIPSIITAAMLAAALNVSLDDLCSLEESKELEPSKIISKITLVELLLKILNECKFKIHVNENDIIMTVPKDPIIEDDNCYFPNQVLLFFKEYEKIQEVSLSTLPSDMKDNFIKYCFENLKKDFKDLPNLDYSILKKYATPNKTK